MSSLCKPLYIVSSLRFICHAVAPRRHDLGDLASTRHIAGSMYPGPGLVRICSPTSSASRCSLHLSPVASHRPCSLLRGPDSSRGSPSFPRQWCNKAAPAPGSMAVTFRATWIGLWSFQAFSTPRVAPKETACAASHVMEHGLLKSESLERRGSGPEKVEAEAELEVEVEVEWDMDMDVKLDVDAVDMDDGGGRDARGVVDNGGVVVRVGVVDRLLESDPAGAGAAFQMILLRSGSYWMDPGLLVLDESVEVCDRVLDR